MLPRNEDRKQIMMMVHDVLALRKLDCYDAPPTKTDGTWHGRCASPRDEAADATSRRDGVMVHVACS